MSAPRFDRLEAQIVDALRQAPGAAPSSELDARILARAHAAVRPAKRRQPRWFSMAAGLLVLVGSGLALRIWEQLETAPSALDAPSAPPAATAPAGTVNETMALESPPAAERQETPDAAVAKQRQQTGSDSAQVQRALAQSKLEAAPSLAAPEDSMADALAPAPKPIAQAFPQSSAAPAPVLADGPAPPPEPQAEPVAAAPAAPAAARDSAAIATSGALRLSKSAEAAAKMAPQAAAAAEGALAQPVESEQGLELDRTPRKQADPFLERIEVIRLALANGATADARSLLRDLQRDYPDRSLPDDLRQWQQSPQ